MKTLLVSLWAISLVMALLGGCGTTTGNYLVFEGTRPGSLSLARGFAMFAASEGPVTLSVINRDGSTAGTLVLSTAKVAIKELKFKRDETGLSDAQKEKDTMVRLSGPYLIDILANTSTPALPNLELAVGNYDRVEFKLDKLEGNEDGGTIVTGDDPMFEKSLYLSGTYTGTVSGGTVTDTSFSVIYDFDEEFKLKAGKNLMELTGEDAIIVAFRLAKWFLFSSMGNAQVDFRDLTTSGGAIALDGNSSGDNQKIWQAIAASIKDSIDFGKDKDGNGHLASSEDDDDDTDDSNDD